MHIPDNAINTHIIDTVIGEMVLYQTPPKSAYAICQPWKAAYKCYTGYGKTQQEAIDNIISHRNLRLELEFAI